MIRLRERAAAVLREKSGVALMLVLGITLMLFAVSVSVVSAASANAGYNARQNEANRIKLLSQSIQRNIQHSLTSAPNPDMLSSQLIIRVFEWYNNPVNEGEVMGDIELDLELGAGTFNAPANLSVNRIALSFKDERLDVSTVDVRITEPRGFIPGIPSFEGTEAVPAIERRPKTASINATMTVIVEITATGVLSDSDRTIVTRATYEFRGGEMSDELAANPLDQTDTAYAMAFATDGFGEWRLVRYETIER
jgi:hypothetical protein